MSQENKLNVLLRVLLMLDKVIDFVISLLVKKDEVAD